MNIETPGSVNLNAVFPKIAEVPVMNLLRGNHPFSLTSVQALLKTHSILVFLF